MIAPNIQGIWPASRSPAEQYAVNQLPIDIPAGPRYVRHTPVAIASRRNRPHEAVVRYAAVDRRHRGRGASAPVELAEAPAPRASYAHSAIRVAYVTTATRHSGLHLIEPAMASENVSHHVGGSAWAIQVGAFGRSGQAHAAASAARGAAGHAHMVVATVKEGRSTLYRARLSGMTHDAAVHACQKLSHARGSCVVVAPSA
jgi:cell division septation protein DedD